MRRAAGLVSSAIVAGLLYGGGFGSGPGSAQASAGDQSIAKRLDHRGAARYWTKRRMQRAQPREVVGPTLNRVPSQAETAEQGPSEPGYRPPAPPPRTHARTFPVDDVFEHPAAVTGKLFGKYRGFGFGGLEYECSASVVNSRNDSVIFTAAHCVRDLFLGWGKKLLFVPAYRHGSAPFGRWKAERAFIPRKWLWLNYDYAAIVLARRDGQTIEEKVGGAGLAWNYPRRQDYRAFGYPFNFFRGNRMMACESPLTRLDRRAGRPNPLGISCRMKVGASGGPWFIQDEDGEYLASVSSYKLRGRGDLLFGPYFTGRAAKLLRKAERKPSR